MNRIIFCSVFVLLFTVHLNAQEGYPVPPENPRMLFYFQRSHNRNTVIYETNILPDGSIDKNKPVIMYWIRYEEGGIKKELSFIQRKAFGLQSELVDKDKVSFVLHFYSFKKRSVYLLKNNSCYKAYITINGELSELTRMYIRSENNSLGIPLKVGFVEISGISLKSNRKVTERYNP